MSNILGIAAKLAESIDFVRVHSVASTGTDGIPDAINELPVALVIPGKMIANSLTQMNNFERHEYTMRVLLLASRNDLPSGANRVTPMIDRLLTVLSQNVTLEGQDTQTKVTGWEFGDFEYGGISYVGYGVDVHIKEDTYKEFRP